MPHARTTDPQTSHDAAQSVTNTSPLQRVILQALTELGPLHDEAIFSYLLGEYVNNPEHDGVWVSPSGARTRRCELVELGLVVDSGERVKTRSNRQAIKWAVA